MAIACFILESSLFLLNQRFYNYIWQSGANRSRGESMRNPHKSYRSEIGKSNRSNVSLARLPAGILPSQGLASFFRPFYDDFDQNKANLKIYKILPGKAKVLQTKKKLWRRK